jgi:Mrp family chromosome partitioning ATPase
MSKYFELLQQIGRERDLFRTAGSVSVSVATADYQQVGTVEIEPRKVESNRPELPGTEIKPKALKTKKPELQSHWRDLVKEKVRTQKSTARATGLDAITRREEVKLVQRIFPIGSQRVPQVVVFSGIGNGSSAPVISARSAEILAARGEGPVCIVDSNLESPYLHRYFRLDNHKGFSDAILDSGPVQDFACHLSDTNVWVIPAGQSTISMDVLGSSERLNARMTELRSLFKYVLIHSPIYLDRASGVPNFATDGLVLIVEANSTRRETVREVMNDLRMSGSRVLGVVLNNRTFPIPEAIYHKL